MGCQDGGGASGYLTPGCPACVRPPRGTRQTGQAIPAIATWRRRLRPLPPAGCVRPPNPIPLPTPLVPMGAQMGDNQGRGAHMGHNQGRGVHTGYNQGRGATRVMTREGVLTWVRTREGGLTWVITREGALT